MHLLALEIDFHILKVDFSIIQRTEGEKINQNYDEEFQKFNYLDAFCRNWHILENILNDFKFLGYFPILDIPFWRQSYIGAFFSEM